MMAKNFRLRHHYQFALAFYLIFEVLCSGLALAQSCLDSIESTAPDSRYTDNGDGTISDTITNLMWKQCSEGQSGDNCSVGSATKHTWQQALQLTQTLNTSGGYANQTDWRLPNLKELSSLVEEQCYLPAINETIFPNTVSSSYWSASPFASSSSNAWSVIFYYGDDNTYGRSFNLHVRLVRAGQ